MVTLAGRQYWRRAQSIARNIIPLTPAGIAVTAAAAYCYLKYAQEQADLILYATAWVLLLFVAASVAGVVIASFVLRWQLRRRVQKAPTPTFLELESGRQQATGFTLPALQKWPILQLSTFWRRPQAHVINTVVARDQLHEIVSPAHRGEYNNLQRQIILSDIFGLARLGFNYRIGQNVRVAPAKTAITGHVLNYFVPGETLSYPTGPAAGERLDLRRYAHGDPMRHIVWKAFARTRQLIVRTPEQAISPSPSASAYFVAGNEDEPTASAARFFIEEGLLGKNFIFCADGAAQPTSAVEQACTQLIASVDFRHRGAEGLQRFISGLDVSRRAHCVLFLPPRKGPWVDRVVAIARQLRRATAIIGVDDTSLQSARTTWLRRLFFADATATGLQHHQLVNLVQSLTLVGLQVKVLHRPTGTLLDQAQLKGKL